MCPFLFLILVIIKILLQQVKFAGFWSSVIARFCCTLVFNWPCEIVYKQYLLWDSQGWLWLCRNGRKVMCRWLCSSIKYLAKVVKSNLSYACKGIAMELFFQIALFFLKLHFIVIVFLCLICMINLTHKNFKLHVFSGSR